MVEAGSEFAIAVMNEEAHRLWLATQIGPNSLRLFAAEQVNIHLMMAGTVLSVMPTLIIFIFLQRYVIRGIALTGLKG